MVSSPFFKELGGKRNYLGAQVLTCKRMKIFIPYVYRLKSELRKFTLSRTDYTFSITEYLTIYL